MKYLFYAFLASILCVNRVNCQEKDSTTKTKVDSIQFNYISGIDVSYGQMYQSFNKLNEDIAPANFSGTTDIIGASLYWNFSTKKFIGVFFEGGMWGNLGQFSSIPGSTSYKLNGFQANFLGGMDIFGKFPWIDLNLGVGTAAGFIQLRYTNSTVANEPLKYRNSFFALQGLGELRFNTTKGNKPGFSFGGRIMYSWDVRGYSGWNRKDDRLPVLRSDNLSGWGLFVFAGFVIAKANKTYVKKRYYKKTY